MSNTFRDLTQFTIADLESCVSVGFLDSFLFAGGRAARLALGPQIAQIELIQLRAFAALQFTSAKAEIQALLIVVLLWLGAKSAKNCHRKEQPQNQSNHDF